MQTVVVDNPTIREQGEVICGRCDYMCDQKGDYLICSRHFYRRTDTDDNSMEERQAGCE